MNDFRLDVELIDALADGELAAEDEQLLAEQVARLLPFHWELPNALTAALSRLTRLLGEEDEFFEWLGRHPGRPHLVAVLYRLIGFLDWFSANSAIISALRELRSRTPYPKGLAGYIAPDTDTATLAGLSQQIELVLADERPAEAARLAHAIAEMLEQIAPRARELDPDLPDIQADLKGMREEIGADI